MLIFSPLILTEEVRDGENQEKLFYEMGGGNERSDNDDGIE